LLTLVGFKQKTRENHS